MGAELRIDSAQSKPLLQPKVQSKIIDQVFLTSISLNPKLVKHPRSDQSRWPNQRSSIPILWFVDIEFEG